MNKLITLILGLCVGLCLQAQYSFPILPGPTNVLSGTPVTLNINDAANAAGVPVGPYNSVTVTVDWTAGGGNPWSSEADLSITTSAGTFLINPPSGGSASNGDPTTLVFTTLIPDYEPTTDGTLDIILNQSFGGSDADWSNIVVTIDMEPIIPPTPQASISVCPFNTSTVTVGAGEVAWILVTYDGTGGDINFNTNQTIDITDTEIGLYDSGGTLIVSDDDGGDGLLSSITEVGLAAGDYYIAVGAFNTTFGNGFEATTTGTAVGDIVVNTFGTTGACIPTAGTWALICMGFIFLSLGLTHLRIENFAFRLEEA